MVNSDGTVLQGTGAIRVGDGAGSTGTLQIDGGQVNGTGAATDGEIRIGSDGGSGTLAVTAGSINTGGELNVGRGTGATGLANLTGGTVNAGHVIIGRDNGVGTLNLSSDLNSAFWLNVGLDGGVGTVNQTAGAVTFTEWAAIGVGGGPAGSQWDISGGGISSAAGFEVGADRDGDMNISGTANVTAWRATHRCPYRVTGIGLLNVTGARSDDEQFLGVAGAQAGGHWAR